MGHQWKHLHVKMLLIATRYHNIVVFRTQQRAKKIAALPMKNYKYAHASPWLAWDPFAERVDDLLFELAVESSVRLGEGLPEGGHDGLSEAVCVRLVDASSCHVRRCTSRLANNIHYSLFTRQARLRFRKYPLILWELRSRKQTHVIKGPWGSGYLTR